MKRTDKTLWLVLVAAAFLSASFAAACDDEEEAVETGDELEAPEPPPSSRAFSIDSASSNIDFLMEAPLENIHGVAGESVSGDLFIDLSDLTNSRGLVKVDLDSLEIFQRKRESADEELGEETKDETQNEHARTWLQISEDAPAEVRGANRYVQFNIDRFTDVSSANVMEMEGDERTVTATVHGQFRLHARNVEKSARLEITFTFDGDTPQSVRVRTAEPVPVNLAEHAIRPRSAFDSLAQATLATLGQKVAEAAPITFEFTANAGDAVGDMPETAIETSEAAEAALNAGVEEDSTEEVEAE